MPERTTAHSTTVAAYIEHERTAFEKSIYWDGEVFAMAGASRIHNLLTAAILGELRAGLRDRTCQAYSSDQRIRVSETGRYVYPDASVTCKPVLTAAEDPDSIINPVLIFEVLSETTEAFDRGEKFLAYRQLASLSDYVLIAQNTARAEHFSRGVDGSWILRTLERGSSLMIAKLGLEIAINALYDGVFDATS